MAGPLPNPQSRRRNSPTRASTTLPAAGRKGRPPKCPYPLAEAGRTWWKWAWSLPQATAWDKGALYVVARRAALEDDLEILENVGDLSDIVGMAPVDAIAQLEFILGRLKGIASGRSQVMREMRELDNRLGLNPKAMADLRWAIDDDAEPKPKGRKAKVTKLDEYRDLYA
jgi:hypothetical protein